MCGGGSSALTGGATLQVTVFGPGLNAESFQTSTPVAEGPGVVPSVPAGSNRDVVVELLSANQVVLARGESGPITLGGTASLGPEIFLRPVNSFVPAASTAGSCTSMIESRIAHTATVLENGTVLIAGGYTWMGTTQLWLNTTEIYDPAGGTISPGPDMSTRRAFHTATHLPGTSYTLIVGGENAPVGSASGGALGTAEVFDESQQTFTLLPPLPVSLSNGLTRHSAVVPLPNATSGQPQLVLILGGQDYQGNPNRHVAVYTVNDGLLDTGIELAEGRTEAGAIPLSCGVLLVGGWGGTVSPYGGLEDVAVISATDCLTFVELPIAASFASPHIFPLTATLGDGSTVIMDGFNSQGVESIFLNATNVVEGTSANVPADKRGFGIGVGLLDGTMLAAGGGSQPAAGTPTASQTGDILYTHSGALAFRAIPSLMSNARIGAAAALLNDGTVFISGGYDFDSNESPIPLSSIDLFQPEYQSDASTDVAHVVIK
jgi:hypothetical protein